MEKIMKLNINYPYEVKEAEEGGYIVQFFDIEEAFTEGDTLEEALFNALDVLNLSLAGRIDDSFNVPRPSEVEADCVYYATPSVDLQIAIQVHWLREESDVSLADLARSLKTSWPSAQRLEKSGNNPTVNKLNEVAESFGKRLLISFV